MRLSIEGHILLLSIWNPRIPQGAWSGVGAGAAAVATGLMATASSVYWCGAWESSFTQWKRKGFLYQIYRITRDFYFPTSPSSLPLTNLCVHPWTNSWWTVASHFMTDSWTFAGIWDGFQPHQVDLWETAVSGSEKKDLSSLPRNWIWAASGTDGKETACDARDLGLTPGSGRCSAEGKGYPLQYSSLENSIDRRAWRAIIHGVAKS